MEMQQSDFDRFIFFEDARQKAQEAYAKNPLDADNLTRWGGALLELSHSQQGPECMKMLEDAVSKLEEALLLNPRKHETLWCLGNAHTSHGLYTHDSNQAKVYFDRATDCFKQALEEDPGNDLYLKSLDLAAKAPELHLEVQKEIASQASIGGSSASNVKGQASKKKQYTNSDLKYDVLGWVILAVGIVVWVGMASKSQITSPPPR